MLEDNLAGLLFGKKVCQTKSFCARTRKCHTSSKAFRPLTLLWRKLLVYLETYVARTPSDPGLYSRYFDPRNFNKHQNQAACHHWTSCFTRLLVP